MSLKMTKKLATAVDLTVVEPHAAIRFNESPLLGGGGMGGVNGGARNAILRINSLGGGTPTVLVQGHDSVDDGAPIPGHAGWYTIATLEATSPDLVEIELAPWMRTNVTVAGTGTMDITVEGVQ